MAMNPPSTPTSSRTAPPVSFRVSAAVMMAVALVASGGCGAKYLRSAALDAAPAPPAESLSRHVVVVSIDGLRPDAIAAYKAPTLQRLMKEGSYTLTASTILPSKTLPSHTSMLTGLTPEQHGVSWNNVATAQADAVSIPTIFSLARSQGYSTAAFFSKSKFHPLQLEGSLDYSQAPGGLFGRWSSTRTVADVAAYLKEARPNLLFVHLPDPDAAGHRSGWMTFEYGRAVLAADRAVEQLVGLAGKAYGAGKFTVIVTADHGGHGSNHGSDDPRDVTIPWIAWGQGVKPGVLPEHSVRTMDTAATALWLLAVGEPSVWAGKAVVQAYAAGE